MSEPLALKGALKDTERLRDVVLRSSNVQGPPLDLVGKAILAGCKVAFGLYRGENRVKTEVGTVEAVVWEADQKANLIKIRTDSGGFVSKAPDDLLVYAYG